MFVNRFRVAQSSFRLRDRDPADTAGRDAQSAEKDLAADLAEMFQLQDRFYAWNRYALLLVIQALDAAGKDGTIKHVMTGLNPASLPGPLLQGAVLHRTGTRLPLALRDQAARARPHRRL